MLIFAVTLKKRKEKSSVYYNDKLSITIQIIADVHYVVGQCALRLVRPQPPIKLNAR